MYWDGLTADQKAAAALLGYTATTWDNVSGSEPQPAFNDKYWAELTSCPDGEDLSVCHSQFLWMMGLFIIVGM